MSNDEVFSGLMVKEWKQGFRPGMPEFAASRFLFSVEGETMIRIAFGNNGPFVDAKGTREPTYTHAVTLSPETAVELARLLLKHYAAPVAQRSRQATG